MNTYAGRRRSFLLAVLILLLSMLLEQYWLVRLFPWMGGLGSIRPMIVFLDIPLDLPLVDPIPVGILFSFFLFDRDRAGDLAYGRVDLAGVAKKGKACFVGVVGLIGLFTGGWRTILFAAGSVAPVRAERDRFLWGPGGCLSSLSRRGKNSFAGEHGPADLLLCRGKDMDADDEGGCGYAYGIGACG